MLVLVLGGHRFQENADKNSETFAALEPTFFKSTPPKK
jgi:hypothetical protein